MGRVILVTFGVLVLIVPAFGNATQLDDTYYSIELNLETIQCKMCSPGTFLIGHCSRDGDQAICQDCADGRFIKDYNRALYCRRCAKCKGTDKESGELVVAECTRFHDTKCMCKPGYWRERGMVGDCREVSPCMPGFGVKELADSHNDTTCERCVNGKTFSNISSEVTSCQNCSHCLEGWVQNFPCTELNDTVCIKKADTHNNTKCERCVNRKNFHISSEVGPCNENEDIMCIPNDVEEDGSVGIIVVCGVVLIVVGINIVYCRQGGTDQALQKLPCSCSNRRRRENQNNEELNNQQQSFISLEMPIVNT